MQIQTTLRFHYSLFRIATIINNNKFWQGCGEKGTSYFWWERKLIQPLWKNSTEAPQKTKIRSAIRSSNITSRDIPNGM
jgi:hypothetical protein